MLSAKHSQCTSFKQLEIKCQLQNLYLKEYIKFMSSYQLMGFQAFPSICKHEMKTE